MSEATKEAVPVEELLKQAKLLLELAGSSKGTFTKNPVWLYQVPRGEDDDGETIWETIGVYASKDSAQAWMEYHEELGENKGARIWAVNCRFLPDANGDPQARDVFAAIVERLEKHEELLKLLRYHVGWDGELRDVKQHCGHPYVPALGELMMKHFYGEE